MKKLLILLIGFAFTQSIQTKQVEVTITDWSQINLYELIENPVEGNYSFELIDGTYNGVVIGSFGSSIDFIESRFDTQMQMSLSSDAIAGSIFWDDNAQEVIFIPNRKAVINENNHSIKFDNWDTQPDYELTEEITLTFWVTGMFEDEGVGLQGDMNDDEIINVVDIVALVNIIIGE